MYLEPTVLAWHELSSLQIWKASSSDIHYSLPVDMPARLASIMQQVLTDMVIRNAGSDEACHPYRVVRSRPSAVAELEVLGIFQNDGFVQQVFEDPEEVGFRFTAKGEASTRGSRRYRDPVDALASRDGVALQDCSIYELLLRMMDEDWELRIVPAGVKVRHAQCQPKKVEGKT